MGRCVPHGHKAHEIQIELARKYSDRIHRIFSRRFTELENLLVETEDVSFSQIAKDFIN